MRAAPFPSSRHASSPSASSPRPLRLLLLTVIWLPLLLLAAGAWVSWRVTWAHAETELLHTADAAAELGRRVLEGQQVMVDRINDLLRGLTDAEIRDREAELHAEFKAMVASMPQLVTGYVLDRNGTPLISASVFPVPQGIHLTNRDFFAGLRGPDAPPTLVGRVYQGRIDDAPFSTVARRRVRTGNTVPADGFDGVTNVAVDPRAIGAGLGRLIAAPRDAVAMIRTDGEILARFPLLDRPVPPLSPDSEILGSMPEGAEHGMGLQRSPVDARIRLVAFRRIEGWPVFAVAGRDRSAIITDWAWSVALLSTVGLPVIVALVALVRLAEERARQEANARTALAEDSVRRTAATALRASEARYRTLSEVAADVVWSRLETGSMPAPQLSWESFTGQTPSQYRGFGWQDAIHPADREAAVRLWDEATAAGTPYEAELRLRHRDSSWRHCLVRAAPVPLGDGQPGPALWVGAHIDVTPLREAEERQRFLIQEIDHRAKNVLAVVQAAMRLTRAASPEAFVASVEGRVAALARAQTVLAEGRWTGADLRTLLEGELAPFLGGAEGRSPQAELDGPRMLISPAAAQPLSMTVHELATNAVKHGALGSPGGRLTVIWRMDAAAGMLQLRWTERGGPPVAARPQRQGFGTRVLDTTVRQQLGGTAAMEWDPNGLTCTIEVPLARITRLSEGAPSAGHTRG